MTQSETVVSQLPPIHEGCPHLGLDYDRATRSLYIDGQHCCYRSGDAVTIGMGHQAKYCLCAIYPECPVFQQKASLRTRSKRRKPKMLLITAVVIVALVGILQQSSPVLSSMLCFIGCP